MNKDPFMGTRMWGTACLITNRDHGLCWAL